MRLLKRLLAGSAVLLVLAALALALVLRHTAECEPSTPAAPTGQAMQAIRYRCYGPPEVLAVETVARPAPAADEVLVRVHAAPLNPLDRHHMRGEPYFMRLDSGIGRPADARFGTDFAGVVEAVGSSVTRFRPGDEVFGGLDGALAEYLTVREGGAVARKPAQVSFVEAAAVPIAGLTALQALRDKAGVKPGQKVLVNGGSGGVGSYAIQIARAFGAEVTGVASTRNQELMRALGADHVIDYTQTDFTRGGERYDVIIDNVGNHSPLAYRRVLAPRGVVVMIGSAGKGAWLGPLVNPLAAMLVDPFVDQRFEMILASLNARDLDAMAALLAAGKVRSLVERRYPLAATPDAIAHLESGRARGKLVVEVVGADRALP